MSRAMNLTLDEAEVVALCEKFAVTISVTEPLPTGGTHLVCVREEGAELMRVKFKNHLVAGPVRRFPFYRDRGPW
ncbi:hypothetical protein EDF56_10226 [Novosphingobium sp. PhB165]|nr:hypothetical protein EDF56_10226 [Novosphingobium sp. PhB165]